MRASTMWVLMIVTVVAAAGCGDRETSTNTTTVAATSGSPGVPATVTSPAGPAPADAQAPAVTAVESRYLNEALQRGMGQIELAQSVSRRSESDAVDSLAREIIAAHNDINAELTRIAFRSSVTLPNDAGPELRQTIARLDALDGRNLDASWLAEILQKYPDLIQLHGSAATTATDMELKQVAVRARAMFETNLRQARAAYAQVTGVVPPQKPEPGSLPPASAASGKEKGR